jgi:enoyl reductase-like protein
MATRRSFPRLTFTKTVGPEVAIDSSDVEQFCDVVGNQGESFKTARNNNVQVPMDYAITTCWKVISIPSVEVVKGLLFGGAHVVITNSSYTSSRDC